MSEVNHWLTVADGLEVARMVGRLSVCTCGASAEADAMCNHCRLEAAKAALSKLQMHSLAQQRTLELLQDRGKRRAIARTRLDQTVAEVVVEAPEGRGEAAEEVLEELTDVLSGGDKWETWPETAEELAMYARPGARVLRVTAKEG